MADRTAHLSNTLLDKGYRLTRARLSILDGLVASEGHVSADDLADIVHESDPMVGRMTVYRTLDLLTELGLIRPVYQGSAAAHYILMDNGHHHHLVCSACNQVIEFEQCVLREIEQTVRDHYQFEIQGHLLEIYGRCLDCQG
jgi:Fur family ferric uptake transcriptional regulator